MITISGNYELEVWVNFGDGLTEWWVNVYISCGVWFTKVSQFGQIPDDWDGMSQARIRLRLKNLPGGSGGGVTVQVLLGQTKVSGIGPPESPWINLS